MLSAKARYRLLCWSLAFVWLWTGIVTLFLYPMGESLELLGRVGIPAGVGLWLARGLAILEIIMGLAMLANWGVKFWAVVQVGLMLGFTFFITFFLPEFWVHPFGPISKNVPLIGSTLILYFWAKELS